MSASNFNRNTVEVLTIIDPGERLDPIDVLFVDYKPGAGRIIIRCYSQAWTAWWGAMGEQHNVRSFFLKAQPDYLVGNLMYGPGQHMRVANRKRQEEYLERIVRAIQLHLRD